MDRHTADEIGHGFPDAGELPVLGDASLADDGTDEPQSLIDQMGGWFGLIASTLPIIVLVPVNSKWGLTPALLAAVGVTVVIFLWRLLSKESLQPAWNALASVLIGAIIARATGSAKGYFLYGIWMSLLFAVVTVISVVVHWPIVGVIWKGLSGDEMTWRSVAPARRLYAWASLGWAAVFVARFVVQNNLYNHDSTGPLALARILMGWPLTGVVTLLTVWLVKRADAITDKTADHSIEGDNA